VTDEKNHGTHHFGQHSNLTDIEIEIIVESAVRKTFITLGADLSDGRSIQELQKDFAFMRRQRVGGEKAAELIKRTAIGSFIGGGAYALWEGCKAILAAKGVAP